MTGLPRLGLLVGLLCGGLGAAERWRLEYFHDEDDTTLALADLKFGAPQFGIAVGNLLEGRHAQPVALLTGDGGAKWSTAELPEAALSLFLRSQNLGWMVTASGVWRSQDAGRTWKRLARLRGLLRVHFVSDQHGFAVGVQKAVYETNDGGQNWTPVKAAAEPMSTPEFTTYGCIDFVGERLGLIAGSSRPPRRERQRFPDWMDPAGSRSRREWPTLTILLETRDGGQNWRASQTSLFGVVSQIRLSAQGRGLALVRFLDWFDWPSEVHLLDWRTGRSARIFRQADRDITDIVIVPDGTAYLAGLEPAGRLPGSPIPGKLKILRSRDWATWEEMQVDYRAVACRVMFATTPEGQLWAATDTGMILKLAAE